MKTDNGHKRIRITFVAAGLVAAALLTSAASARATTWTKKADMPTARWGLSTSVVNEKIYAIGGVYSSSSKKLEEYDPATDTWTQKADMPTARVFVASIALDGRIYVIGGETHWQGGTKLATVEEYDPTTDTWTQKTDMPTPRNVLGTSVVDGKIYAIGGGSTSISLKSVEEYDPATDTWTEKADMPTGRKGLSASVFNGKIYAIAGGLPDGGPVLSAVEEYDPATDAWTKKTDMPAPRTGLSTSVVGDKIYAFGGTDRRGGSPFSTSFQYDPATDTWTAKEDMPVRILGMSTSVVGGRVYIIGGTSAGYPYSPSLSTVWEYNVGPTAPSPDFNGDGIVDCVDMCIMVAHWHTENALYDIAPLPFGDDFIDAQDLIVLVDHLGKEVQDPTLAAHWAFDEVEDIVAYDSAGANDGTVIGVSAWQPAGGAVGGALEFDGATFVAADCVLDPKDGPFSVLAWVKGGAPGQVIVSQHGGANWLTADAIDGSLMTDLRAGGRSPVSLGSQTVIADGNWHRAAFTWDGENRRLYVDDVLVAEDTQIALGASAGNQLIGCGTVMAADTFYTGLIDDVRIYNRVVSP
jgi:N-acetylneuraminic acid mutarotase